MWNRIYITTYIIEQNTTSLCTDTDHYDFSKNIHLKTYISTKSKVSTTNNRTAHQYGPTLRETIQDSVLLKQKSLLWF